MSQLLLDTLGGHPRDVADVSCKRYESETIRSGVSLAETNPLSDPAHEIESVRRLGIDREPEAKLSSLEKCSTREDSIC
jgi:hypothetical protein